MQKAQIKIKLFLSSLKPVPPLSVCEVIIAQFIFLLSKKPIIPPLYHLCLQSTAKYHSVRFISPIKLCLMLTLLSLPGALRALCFSLITAFDTLNHMHILLNCVPYRLSSMRAKTWSVSELYPHR